MSLTQSGWSSNPTGRLNTQQIERRCHRVAEDLTMDMGDEIALLRDARVLKTIHGKLSLALRRWIRATGRSESALRAEAALATMEHDLRRVLLDYTSLREKQLYDLLMRAVAGSLETLDLLEDAVAPVGA